MDLGSVKPVSAITSGSFAQGSRDRQVIMIYASSSKKDPGWDVRKYEPLGCLDSGDRSRLYTAASLRAAKSERLGPFRWIIWCVAPVNEVGGVHERAVEIAR
jgi:hypothetical protein